MPFAIDTVLELMTEHDQILWGIRRVDMTDVFFHAVKSAKIAGSILIVTNKFRRGSIDLFRIVFMPYHYCLRIRSRLSSH